MSAQPWLDDHTAPVVAPLTPRAVATVTLVVGLALGYLSGLSVAPDGARIGGSEVPNHLRCSDEDLITVLPGEPAAVCVHIDAFLDSAID